MEDSLRRNPGPDEIVSCIRIYYYTVGVVAKLSIECRNYYCICLGSGDKEEHWESRTHPQPRNYRHCQIPRYPYQPHSKLEHSRQQDCTESKHDFSLPPQKHSHMPTQNQTPSLNNTGTSHPRICQHHNGTHKQPPISTNLK